MIFFVRIYYIINLRLFKHSFPILSAILLFSSAKTFSELISAFCIPDAVDKIVTEKDDKIHQRYHKRCLILPRSDNEKISQIHTVKNRNILYLDGNYHKKRYGMIGIKHGKGKEKRKIQIVICGISRNKSEDDTAYNTEQIEYIKLEYSPFAFQCTSDKPIEI